MKDQIANLDRSQEIILHDLDTALSLLPHLSELYAKLEPKEQRDLLRLVVKNIVIDDQGNIREVDLLPPFMYIHDVHKRAKKRIATSRNKTTTCEMGGGTRATFVFRCSTQVSLGDPQVSGSEPLAPNLSIQNFAHYVELTAYPQRSALEPLLTERKG